jgi:hypothetical protein
MKRGMPTVSSGRDDHLGHHQRMEDHLLGVRRLVGDDAGAADFRAGARRGRHRDDREDALGVGAGPPVADILEIPHRPGLAGHEGDDLAVSSPEPPPKAITPS